MAKPVVFVIGATGNIGSATVTALSSKHADKLDIRAGVRNPDKADKLKGLAGVSVVQAEIMMGCKEKLVGTFKGVRALFIVTPPTENRDQLVIPTAEAAKEAGVEHVAFISSPLTETNSGHQLKEVEMKIKQLGVAYTFFYLSFFFENNFGFKDTIQGQSSLFGPVDPTKPFTSVAVGDAGKAAAAVLADPSKHANKTYKIISDRHTFGDVAAAFSEALGKQVNYVRVPYEAAKQAFLGMGYQEWQVDGIMELYKMIDNGSPVTNQADVSDYTQITGEQPTDLKTWVGQVAGAFK